uniref:Uncharacterized protein n=1 Tax=Eutreptiella gymnastica TaxID=73025 RepID=A0A7S4CB64_9EUGL
MSSAMDILNATTLDRFMSPQAPPFAPALTLEATSPGSTGARSHELLQEQLLFHSSGQFASDCSTPQLLHETLPFATSGCWPAALPSGDSRVGTEPRVGDWRPTVI